MTVFNKHSATPMMAVNDTEKAKEFYGEIMGLDLRDMDMGDMFMMQSGDTEVLVYRSQFAGTNKANALAWGLGEQFDKTVQKLKEKKVSFEHYDDLPGVKIEGDIHVAGDMRLAWFKDPSGNVLHINNM